MQTRATDRKRRQPRALPSRSIQARGRETYMPRAQSDDVSVADRDAGSKGAIRAPAPRRVRVMARATSRP